MAAAFRQNALLRSVPKRIVTNQEAFTRGGLKPQMFAPRGLGYYDAFAQQPEQTILSATTGPATPISGHSTDTIVGEAPVTGGVEASRLAPGDNIDLSGGAEQFVQHTTNSRLLVFNPGSSDQLVGMVYKCVSVDGKLRLANVPIEVSQFEDMARPRQNEIAADLRSLEDGTESIPLRMSVRIRNITEALSVGGTVRFLRYNGGTNLLSRMASAFEATTDLSGEWTPVVASGASTYGQKITFAQHGHAGTMDFSGVGGDTYRYLAHGVTIKVGVYHADAASYQGTTAPWQLRFNITTITASDVLSNQTLYTESDIGKRRISFASGLADDGTYQDWHSSLGTIKQVTSDAGASPMGVGSYFKLLQQIRDSDRTRVMNGKELLETHQSNLYPADFVRSMTFSADTTFEEAVEHPKYCTLFVLIDEFSASQSGLGNTYEVNVQVHRAARYAPGTLLHALAREFTVANAAHSAHTKQEQSTPAVSRLRESTRAQVGININPRQMQFGFSGAYARDRELIHGRGR